MIVVNSDEPDCDLGWAVGMVSRTYAAHVEPIAASLPHGARGYQVLYAVIHKDLPSQLGLARYLGIDRSVMTHVLDALVAAGFVTREEDPADRRQRRIVATATGRRTFSELERRVRVAEDDTLANLDDEDRAAFRSLLSVVARQARDETASPKSRDDDGEEL
jgi:MarR family transcriptional regulator for hemolysin